MDWISKDENVKILIPNYRNIRPLFTSLEKKYSIFVKLTGIYNDAHVDMYQQMSV